MQDFAIWHALYSVEVRHWHDVNFNAGRSAHELYVENGVFTVGPQERRGRSAIRDFYEARAKRGIRTARHVLTNFQVLTGEDDRHRRASGIISLYAGDRLPPLDSRPAVLIADLANEFTLEDDGVWRYRSHVLHPVFVGDDAFVRHALSSTNAS